jgi:microcystin degradation protein MlrC
MRIATLGISHETNTFSLVPAIYDAFTIVRGEEMVEANRDATYTVSGYI